MIPEFAVNSLAGRAKLDLVKEPLEKSGCEIGIAFEST